MGCWTSRDAFELSEPREKQRVFSVGVYGNKGSGKSAVISSIIQKQDVPFQSIRVPLSSIAEDWTGRDGVVDLMEMDSRQELIWSLHAKHQDLAILVADLTQAFTTEYLFRVITMLYQCMTTPRILFVGVKRDVLIHGTTDEHQDNVAHVLEMVYEHLGPFGIRRVNVSNTTGENLESLRGELGNLMWKFGREVPIPKRRVKMVIVGDYGVGKTTFLQCAVYGKPPRRGVTTTMYNDLVEIDVVGTESKQSIGKLSLWDTAGQERYRCVPEVLLRGADLVLLVMDCGKINQLSSDDNRLFCNRVVRVVFMKSDVLPTNLSYLKDTDFFFSNKDAQKIRKFVLRECLELWATNQFF